MFRSFLNIIVLITLTISISGCNELNGKENFAGEYRCNYALGTEKYFLLESNNKWHWKNDKEKKYLEVGTWKRKKALILITMLIYLISQVY